MPGSHAGAVAYLLEKGVYRAWTSHFDLSILATLYFYVVCPSRYYTHAPAT